MHHMGLIGSGIRLPLTPLSDVYHERMHRALQQAEIRVKSEQES
jgi:4-hydroxy-tetrahydrodipicolinate synthase